MFNDRSTTREAASGLHLAGLEGETVSLGAVDGDRLARDVLLHPYSEDHFWNLPLGRDALEVPLGMKAPGKNGLTDYVTLRSELDQLFMTPDLPRDQWLTVFEHNGGWRTGDRCGQKVRDANGNPVPLRKLGKWNPLPIVWHPMPVNKHNQCCAVLVRDGTGNLVRVEFQPVQACPDGTVVGQYSQPAWQGGRIDGMNMPEEDSTGHGIKAPGVGGSHGGSGIEAFGGTIRLHETTEIPHALKLVFNTGLWLKNVSRAQDAYRWPAVVADAGWDRYGAQNPAGGRIPAGMKMGCLLALPRSFDVETRLRTDPGKVVGRALWRYGGYVVDGAQAHDAFYIATEESNDGRFEDRWHRQWGIPWKGRTAQASGLQKEFLLDIELIYESLVLIDDNHRNNIGGAGQRRYQKAPPLRTGPMLPYRPDGAVPAPSVAVGHGVGAASQAPGLMSVFAVGVDNALWIKQFNGSVWGGWGSLGGTVTSTPAAVSPSTGIIDVFVRGADNAMWTKRYNGSSWSPWISLGGTLASAPAATSRAAGTINVFVVGTDQAVWTRSFDGSTWGGWRSLGGTVTATPSATSVRQGTMTVLALGADAALRVNYWNGSWSGWRSLGGTFSTAVSSTSRSLDTLDIFARGADNALWTTRFVSRWGEWASLGGTLTSPPAAVSYQPGTAAVFARGTDSALWCRVDSGGGFGGWSSLGGDLR